MKNLNYEKALNELQEIAVQLQNGEIGLEELTVKIKRAGELINYCKEKLRTAEDELSKVLSEDS